MATEPRPERRTQADVAPPPPPPASRAALLLRHPVAVGVALIAVVALLRASWLVREVLTLAFAAVLVAVVMGFPVRLLSKKLPRGVAVLITLLLMGGVAAGLGALTVPPLIEQGREFTASIPKITEQLRGWYAEAAKLGTGMDGADSDQIATQIGELAPDMLSAVVTRAVPAVMGSAEGVIAMLLTFILGAFFVHRPEDYRKGLRALVPRPYERDFDELWRRLSEQLRQWLGGMLVSMSIMGALAALGLALAGIEQWPMLGALTFFGTFVPYLGGLASAIPGLLLAIAQSPTMLAAVFGIYLGIHIIEGYFVQPIIMKRAVHTRPALLLLFQAAFGALFGIGGIIIATPLLVCLKVTVKYLYVERALGKTTPSD